MWTWNVLGVGLEIRRIASGTEWSELLCALLISSAPFWIFSGARAYKENENGVSNGVLTKDAFFLITTVSYRSPRKKSITFEQGGVFMPIFPLFY